MSLVVISTPIGNEADITARAIESLKAAQVIICEEFKPARILLKKIGAGEKELYQLNEHSRSSELSELLELCRHQKVALISDCGTPGFCDPGADLVQACYGAGIPVDVNPGASSLMALLALTGEKIGEFHFVGFLPAEKIERQKKIQSLKSMRVPYIIMDTPYRLQATLQELAAHFGSAKGALGVDLTGEKQRFGKASLKELAAREWAKAPFVLMVFP